MFAPPTPRYQVMNGSSPAAVSAMSRDAVWMSLAQATGISAASGEPLEVRHQLRRTSDAARNHRRRITDAVHRVLVTP